MAAAGRNLIGSVTVMINLVIDVEADTFDDVAFRDFGSIFDQDLQGLTDATSEAPAIRLSC